MDATINVKSLWGEEFRVVEHGLAEVDVVKFVERLLTQQRAMEERVAHLTSLNQLATKTVERAQEAARIFREDAERETAERCAAMIQEAERQSRVIIQEATRAAEAFKAESLKRWQQRTADLEQAMSIMVRWPEHELQRVRDLDERIRSFCGVFEGLVKLLRTRVDTDLEPAALAADGEPLVSRHP